MSLPAQLVQLLGALSNRPEPALTGDEIDALKGHSLPANGGMPVQQLPRPAAESREPQARRRLRQESASPNVEQLLLEDEWMLQEAEDDGGDDGAVLQDAASILQSLPAPMFLDGQPEEVSAPSASTRATPHPVLGSPPAPLRVGSVICTVVIHLECLDDYGAKQSQTTVLLVEVPARTGGPAPRRNDKVSKAKSRLNRSGDSAAAAAESKGAANVGGTRAPLIRSTTQVLKINGHMLNMMDVYGLDTSIDVVASPSSPPSYSPSPPAPPPRGRIDADSTPMKDEEIRSLERVSASPDYNDSSPDLLPSAGRQPLSQLNPSDLNSSALHSGNRSSSCLGSSKAAQGLRPHGPGAGSSVSSIASTSSSVSQSSCVSLAHNGSPCLICLTEPKDCVLLPCRHLCCCAGCVQGLYKSTIITTDTNRQDTEQNNPERRGFSLRPRRTTSSSGADAARTQHQHDSNAEQLDATAFTSQGPAIRVRCKPLQCPMCRARIEDVMQLPI